MYCKHALMVQACTHCRVTTTVFVTGAGSVYHRVRDCSALKAGQTIAADQGGSITRVMRRKLPAAEGEGRRPCKSCW